MKACTVIARNYLPYARVLTASFLAHHPHGEMHVLVIDDQNHEITDEAFRVVRPSDLPMSAQRFGEMATMYDVLELSTALKPWLLRLLLVDGSPVTYLDPDIEVFSDIQEADTRARTAEIILTPHFLVPPPRDGLHPGETDILMAGTYNLGFLTVASGAHQFLDWWADRLAQDCIVAPEQGYFVDQRWMDVGAHYFASDVVRDPGWNVAYWNAHERPLERRGSSVFVDGHKLRFFHFSGFEPERPEVLSRHQVGRPRIEPADSGVLRDLCQSYSKKLLGAGYAAARDSRYGFGTSIGGVDLARGVRRAYRDAIAVRPGIAHGFDATRLSEFTSWIRESESMSSATIAPQRNQRWRALRHRLAPVKQAVKRRVPTR